MKFKLGDQVVVSHDGKIRPLDHNTRSRLGVVTEVKDYKNVKVKFTAFGEQLELWFQCKLQPRILTQKRFRGNEKKIWYSDKGFLNFWLLNTFKEHQEFCK